MKIIQEEVVDRQTVLNFEVEDSDLAPYLDKGYRKLVQRLQIPGFRKGKAPRNIVEQFVGRQGLLNEMLDSMLPELTNRAIEEEEVEAGGLPRIELVDFEPLKVKATVPLSPEIELGSYREIRITPEIEAVSDKDVQQRIEELQTRLASWEPVERESEMGDMVTMKIVGTIDERTVLSDDSAVFILDEEGTRPTPDFAANLIGLRPEEEKNFAVTLPDDYADKTVAGKEAQFLVNIDEIKSRVLPDLDDEFAKSVGDGHEDLDSLKSKLQEDLETEASQRSDVQLREELVKTIVEDSSVNLPPLIIEQEVAHMENEQAGVLERANIRMSDYLQSIGKTEEEMKKELEDQAVQKLNSALVLSKIGDVEEIAVTDDEVEDRLRSIATGSEDESRKANLRGSIRRMLTTEKTMDQLVKIAKGEHETTTDSPDDQQGEATEDEGENDQDGDRVDKQ